LVVEVDVPVLASCHFLLSPSSFPNSPEPPEAERHQKMTLAGNGKSSATPRQIYISILVCTLHILDCSWTQAKERETRYEIIVEMVLGVSNMFLRSQSLSSHLVNMASTANPSNRNNRWKHSVEWATRKSLCFSPLVFHCLKNIRRFTHRCH
jgi:hypothetical protein